MLHRSFSFVSLWVLLGVVGCGPFVVSAGDDDAGSATTDGATTDGATSDSGGAVAGVFDPGTPGVRVSFTIGTALMLGQSVSLAAGGFVATGREDLDPLPGAPEVPFETCEETVQVHTSTCVDAQDCAPEQQCVPETNRDGEAIPDSLHCATPKTAMDVGPFTVDGFSSGPTTMLYNASQSGGYTTEGGDGTIDSAEIVFDTTYTFHGAGDPSQGLGAFSGELHLSSEILLTQPAITTVSMGIQGVEVDESEDLVLAWDGADPGAEMTISLSGATMGSENHVVTCRTHDSGSFTIPAAMVQAAQLGDMAFINTLTFERKEAGTVSGDGVTSHDVGTVQSAIFNVARVP